ncbi:MAG: GNAT family N-acetyltransferase [Deltaproteobacteria bacterium]|nr:GNAT family N-acetyltransferase [Deltaproteobacteria bacterium]
MGPFDRRRGGTTFTRLRDGAALQLRPIETQDRAALQLWLATVSPESRYLRFHGNFSSLTESQWRHLTEVDGQDRLGLLALIEGQVVGIGHVIRLNDAPHTGEIALLVSDCLQRLGIGSALRDRLVRAARRVGIKRLIAHVLPNNQGMRRLLEAGPFKKIGEQGGAIEVELLPPRRGQRWRRILGVLFGLHPRWLRGQKRRPQPG